MAWGVGEGVDPTMEVEAKAWIEAVLGEGVLVGASLQEALKSGVVLVNLINAIRPGTCKPPQQETLPPAQCENIKSYLTGCAALGIPPSETFTTADLYKGRNMSAVVVNLHALGRTAQRLGFFGPGVGTRMAMASMHVGCDAGAGEAAGLSEGRPAAGGPLSAASYLSSRPPSFLCPLSGQLLRDPVVCADGHTYERVEIISWLASNETSPKTGEALVHPALVRNHALREAILAWLALGVQLGAAGAAEEVERRRGPLPAFEDMSRKLVDAYEGRQRSLSDRLAQLTEQLRLQRSEAVEGSRLSTRLDERRMDQMERMEEEVAAAREDAAAARGEAAAAKAEAAAAKEQAEQAARAAETAVAEGRLQLTHREQAHAQAIEAMEAQLAGLRAGSAQLLL